MIKSGLEIIHSLTDENPFVATICLRSNTVEVFQRTGFPDGEKVNAISYESEGFCAPVKGVDPSEPFLVIDRYDVNHILKKCRLYRVAGYGIAANSAFGVMGQHDLNFLADKCQEIAEYLADNYNILVDGRVLAEMETGFHTFEDAE